MPAYELFIGWEISMRIGRRVYAENAPLTRSAGVAMELPMDAAIVAAEIFSAKPSRVRAPFVASKIL